MKRNTILRYLSALFLILVLSGCSTFSNQKELEALAARFQVTPSWDAIRDHFSHQFRPGMAREEVHKILGEVGLWKIDSAVDGSLWMDPERKQLIYSEGIWFTEGGVGWEMGYWIFLYNKDDQLVDWHFVDR